MIKLLSSVFVTGSRKMLFLNSAGRNLLKLLASTSAIDSDNLLPTVQKYLLNSSQMVRGSDTS